MSEQWGNKTPKLISLAVVMVGAPGLPGPMPFNQRPEFYALDNEGIVYKYSATTGRWSQEFKGWF